MDWNYLLISCRLQFKNVSIRTFALLDTGATGFAFADKDFASVHSLPLQLRTDSRGMKGIDGLLINSGAGTHIARHCLYIHGHEYESRFFVTSLAHYPLVLGIPLLKLRDVAIRCKSNSLTFGYEHCSKPCRRFPGTAVVGAGITIPLPESPAEPIINLAMISAVTMRRLFKKKVVQLYVRTLFDITQAIEAKTSLD